MADETRKLDEGSIPGGLYRDGSKPGKDGKHFGGRVVNANGDTLVAYEPTEENPGADGFEFDAEKQRAVPIKPAHKKHEPIK